MQASVSLIHNSLKDEFAEKAVARIRQLKYGDPKEEDTQIACLISEKAAVKVEKKSTLLLSRAAESSSAARETALSMIRPLSWMFLRQPMLPRIWKYSDL